MIGLPERLRFQGKAHSLLHLAPFTHRLIGQGPDGADIVLRVSFQSHVVSRSEGVGAHDFLDETGKRRWFCPDRYTVSQTLPDAMRRIIDRNGYSWEMRDRNRAAHLAVLAHTEGKLVSGHHDVVFYYLYRSSVPGIDVELIVKTCYTMTIDFSRHRKRDRIRSLIKSVRFNGGRIPKG